MESKNILALDVATSTGWCFGNDVIVNSGVKDLTDKSSTFGWKVRKFEIWLEEIFDRYGPEFIAFEKTFGQHKNALIHQSELHGVLKNFAHKRNIDIKGYTPTEIKKFATGKGNANKSQMEKACFEKFQITPSTDDEADACHIWSMANEEINNGKWRT